MAAPSSLHKREGRNRAEAKPLCSWTLSCVVNPGLTQQAGFPSGAVRLAGRHCTRV